MSNARGCVSTSYASERDKLRALNAIATVLRKSVRELQQRAIRKPETAVVIRRQYIRRDGISMFQHDKNFKFGQSFARMLKHHKIVFVLVEIYTTQQVETLLLIYCCFGRDS